MGRQNLAPNRRITLTIAEQRALLWLLHATDNGAIISGADYAAIAELSDVAQRLRKPQR